MERTGAVTDEAGVVEGFAERLGHFDSHRVGEVDHRVFEQRVRGAVRHAPNLRVQLDVVERHVGLRHLDVLADRASGEPAGATRINERVAVHHSPLRVLREHAKLLDEPDDLIAEFGARENAAERVDAAGLGAALNAVILAPPTGLGIAEHVALQVHSRAVRGLGVLERAEVVVRLRHGILGSLFHCGLLHLGGLDRLGGGGTLQHGPQFRFLHLHALQELNPLAELVGALFEAAEAGLLLLGHRRGLFALGGVLGHRLHLGDNGSQFIEQSLELFDSHVSVSCVRGRRPMPPIPSRYGDAAQPLQHTQGGQ